MLNGFTRRGLGNGPLADKTEMNVKNEKKHRVSLYNIIDCYLQLETALLFIIQGHDNNSNYSHSFNIYHFHREK